MEVSRTPIPTATKGIVNSLSTNVLHPTRTSPSIQRKTSESSCSNDLVEQDAISFTTAIDVFYSDWDSSTKKGAPSPVPAIRQYNKGSCPLASEECIHLLGDSAITTAEWEREGSEQSGSRMNGGKESDDCRKRNGAINDKGTLPTHVVPSSNGARSCPEEGCVDTDVTEFGNGISTPEKDSNFRRSSIQTKGESGCRVNETIRDDDCLSDKSRRREVPSFQTNDDSQTLPSYAKSAQDPHPPLYSISSYPSTSSTRRLSDNEVLDDDYGGGASGEKERNTGRANNNESVEFKVRYSRQIFAAFAANFGAIAIGTVLSWTSPALPDLRQRKTIGEISAQEETWISAIALLGAASACPIVGYGIEKFGRKRCLLLLTLPFLVGWTLITLAQNIWMIYVGRFLSGFCGGGGSIAIPVYVTESASVKIRGMLASGFDMMITVGILYIFVVGTFVSWEWQAVACGVLPILFHLLMLLVPESPTYLIEQGKNSDASNALQWLRGASSSQQVERELEELISSVNESKNKSACWRDLLEKSALKPTTLAVLLMVFQQLAAIDAVMFYTVDIFEESGVDINENLSANIVGAIQVCATITAAIVVDHGGRRLLLLISEIFMVISLGAMGTFFYLKHENNNVAPEGLGWLPLVSLMVYVVAFSVGMGPLPWLLMGELLPLHIKGKASGLVTITRWMLGFCVTFLFQFLKAEIGPHGCYWVFGGCCLVGTIFVFLFVPETKGKTLDEIQLYFSSGNPPEARERRNSEKAPSSV